MLYIRVYKVEMWRPFTVCFRANVYDFIIFTVGTVNLELDCSGKVIAKQLWMISCVYGRADLSAVNTSKCINTIYQIPPLRGYLEKQLLAKLSFLPLLHPLQLSSFPNRKLAISNIYIYTNIKCIHTYLSYIIHIMYIWCI